MFRVFLPFFLVSFDSLFLPSTYGFHAPYMLCIRSWKVPGSAGIWESMWDRRQIHLYQTENSSHWHCTPLISKHILCFIRNESCLPFFFFSFLFLSGFPFVSLTSKKRVYGGGGGGRKWNYICSFTSWHNEAVENVLLKSFNMYVKLWLSCHVYSQGWFQNSCSSVFLSPEVFQH